MTDTHPRHVPVTKIERQTRASTYLDPSETTGISTPPTGKIGTQVHRQNVESCFRHSGVRPERNRVIRAYLRLQISQRRMQAYNECGQNAWVVRRADNPKQYAIRCDRCHDRFCPTCGRERGLRYARRIGEVMDAKDTRMITLTLRGRDAPLREQLKRLTDCFASLRKTVEWKATQKGGVTAVELKLSSDGRRWHPHLHVLSHGRYLAQRSLSQVWLAITGDSYIVDIRRVRDANQLGHYVTKYVTKPLHNAVYRNETRLCEAIEALKGKRVLNTFGDRRGLSLNVAPEDVAEWERVGSLCDIVRRSLAGDKDACDVLAGIAKCGIVPGRIPVEPRDGPAVEDDWIV